MTTTGDNGINNPQKTQTSLKREQMNHIYTRVSKSETCGFSIMNEDTFKCYGCKEGYFMTKEGCKQSNITNCMKYNPVSYLCEECEKGYYLNDKGECLTCSTYGSCEYCNKSSCLKCSYEYKLSAEGECYKYDNCTIMNENCVKCSETKYYSKDSYCYHCPNEQADGCYYLNEQVNNICNEQSVN